MCWGKDRNVRFILAYGLNSTHEFTHVYLFSCPDRFMEGALLCNTFHTQTLP